MNKRILTIVACALVLSACASYLAYRAVEARAPAGKAPPSVAVVVAARDLAVGTLIGQADLKTVAWFGPPPAGAALKGDALLNRGVVSPVYEGELVTEQRLAPIGSGGGLAATIPPGMRACAVKVNEVVGVAGFVVPGMRVDVLIAGLPPAGDALDGPKVRTLLQNIQVLSAGVNFQRDKEGKPEQAQVVNLLVTPAQAEVLSLASNETHIQWCCGIPWTPRFPFCRGPFCRISTAVRARKSRLQQPPQTARNSPGNRRLQPAGRLSRPVCTPS